MDLETEKDISSKFEYIGESQGLESESKSTGKEDSSAQAVYEGMVLDDLTKITQVEEEANKDQANPQETDTDDSDDSQSSSEEDDEDEDYDFAGASSDGEDEHQRENHQEEAQQSGHEVTPEVMEKLKKSYQIKEEEEILLILKKKINEVQKHFEYAKISKKFVLGFLKKFNFDVKRTCEAMVEPVMEKISGKEKAPPQKQNTIEINLDLGFKLEYIEKQILKGLGVVPQECSVTQVKLEDENKMEKTKEFLKSNPE